SAVGAEWLGVGVARRCAVHCAVARHAPHLAVGLGDRAPGVSSFAWILPPGAAHLGHWHVDLSVESRAGDAGSAQQARAVGIGRSDRADRRWPCSPPPLLTAD